MPILIEPGEKTRVSHVLFGEDTDPLIGEVYHKLVGADPSSSEVQQNIARLCWRSRRYESVARAVLAVSVARPIGAGLWCYCVTWPFMDVVPKDITPEFILGVTLGLFRSGIWLDANWKARTEFDQAFPRRLIPIVFDQGQVFDEAAKLINDRYESELSQTIKAWVRGADFNRGDRMADVTKMVDEAHRQFSLESRVELTRIGGLILDQIAYAVFGSISARGRVNAIHYLVDHLLQF